MFLLSFCGNALAGVPIVLEPGSGVVALAGRLEALQDRQAAYAPEAAYAEPNWQPLAGDPGFGFTRAAVWLRFELTQPGPRKEPWFLETNNALLEDVRLYVRDATGTWVEQRAGRRVAHDQWPLDTRSPVFRVDLPPGTYPAMLRLETRNSMSTSVHLWESGKFHARARDEAMAWGAFFGIYALVILFQFLFWKWTRETLSGWYVPYAGLNFFAVLLTLGYPQNALHLSNEVALAAMGLAICLVLVVGMRFSAELLELSGIMPRFSRWLFRVCAVVSGGSGALVLAGYYGPGVAIAQIASILAIVVLTGVSLKLLRRGHVPAGYFLIAFGSFYLGVLIRYLRNLGLLEPGPWTDYSVQTGSIVHMIVMCLLIIYRYNAMQVALQIEQKARQEQRDFVAMVSHEYRTPLAIISTSAQQLAANLGAPPEKTLQRCANIRAATERMSDLLDKYLSTERMEEAGQALNLAAHDPGELIGAVVAEWPIERVRLVQEDLPPKIVCDRPLFEVVLRNLLANADRHAPPDTVIDVAAAGNARGGVRIAVVNRGETIPPDELPRVFQKYFRGRASRGKPGAGLGLYLVRRIVELHGGLVSVASAGDRTEFEMTLPATAGPLKGS